MHINTFTRRQSMLLAGTGLLLPFAGPTLAQARPAADLKALAALEKKVGGRLGVAVLDTGSGQLVGHRLDERFAMCSTFKMPLAAAILREVDQGRMRHDQWVTYGHADKVPHAPITEQHLKRGGMTLVALAEAAQTTSDNVAANVLLKLIGGPAGFTSILRSTGDTITRLDRYEPHMNQVKGQDARDATTPAAMARTTERLLTSDWLSSASREMLIGWMVATTTGELRIRAGLPNNWRSGDKTGTGMAPGMPDKYNDVAIAWPPGKAPLVISAFYETARPHKRGMRDQDQAVLAEVGRIAANWNSAL
jgi:beta-lactamase class A